MFKDEKDVIVNSALDIYHEYGITMEEAMDVAMDTFDSSDLVDEEYEAQKEAVVNTALDIYHEYAAEGMTMEEAMNAAIDMANEAGSSTPSINIGFSNDTIPGRGVTASQFQYSDATGTQKMILQGILKWLEDYKYIPEGPARTALADKISKAINDPIIRNLMMKTGYWETIPEEIHARSAIRHSKKLAKAGRRVERKDAKRERKVEAWKTKRYAKDAVKDAKRAAKESVYDLADEIYSRYDVTEDEAIEAACDELGIDFEDILD